MIRSVTKIQFNNVFLINRLNFTTETRCFGDTGKLFHNIIALKKKEQKTVEKCTAG